MTQDQPINQILIDIESDVDTLPSTEDNDTISICSFDTVDSLPSEINATLSLLLVHENYNAPLYENAIKRVHKAQWLEVIAKEYASSKLNIEPCDLPKGQMALGTKMVLKIKETENPDEPLKYKAWCTVKGLNKVMELTSSKPMLQ